MLKEFKTFIMRGNVLDLAIGIIIGSAFGKIVSSLVADIIMPPIGLIIGGINFTDIKLTLKKGIVDAAGKVLEAPVTMNIGNFLQSALDFLIISFCIFLIVKGINAFQRKREEKAVEAETPAVPSPNEKTETLLAEIRDILAERKSNN